MTAPAAPRPIAVVTVCRDPGPRLEEALASVQSLADARTRHIVIDGASSDGTPDRLQAAEQTLMHWQSEPDFGIYDAMNKGWEAAPSDAWIIFIGADDRLLSVPGVAELESLEHQGNALVYGRTRTGTNQFHSRYGGELRLRNTIHHQSLLVRKDAHPAPPFNPCWRVYGDWEFNLRLWRSGAHAAFSEHLLALAAPGGASAVQPLAETFAIARQHSGLAVASTAWAIAAASRARRALTMRRYLADRIGIRT